MVDAPVEIGLGSHVDTLEDVVLGEVTALVLEALGGEVREVDPPVLLLRLDQFICLDRYRLVLWLCSCLDSLRGDVDLLFQHVVGLDGNLLVLFGRLGLLFWLSFRDVVQTLAVDLIKGALVEPERGFALQGVAVVIEEALFNLPVVALDLDFIGEVVLVDFIHFMEVEPFGGDFLEEIFVLMRVEEGEEDIDGSDDDDIDGLVVHLLLLVDVLHSDGRREDGCPRMDQAQQREHVEYSEMLNRIQFGRKYPEGE